MFVEINQVPTERKMSIQTVFNNVNLDEELTNGDVLFRTLSVSGRSGTEYMINKINVPKMHGMLEDDLPIRNPREITVKFQLKTKNNKQMIDAADKLRSLLTGPKMKLGFTDEINAFYYSTLETLEFPEENQNNLIGHIHFFCSDPDKYKEEQSDSFTDDSILVNNSGTATTKPIIELTAKQKATFAMIANENEEYNLVGTVADIDEQIVDSKNLVLSERGDTLSQWTSSGTQIDEGTVSGSLGTDGTGILPTSYGSGSKWYGPALMREISAIQDFEVEMRLRADTDKPNQMYRIEFYLYDENMNVLGKMAIRDYALHNIRYAAEARFGEFLGGRRNYLISKDNYLKERGHFHGMLRMKRTGKRIEFYVARLKTGADEGLQHDTLRVVYNDVKNELQGRLKFVQINILRHADGPPGNVPRINAINVHELAQVTQDETPYIIYPGDIVTLDHVNNNILLNGESRKDLVNWGADFFELKKGDNTLVVSPEDTFDTKITFREKYK